MSTLEHYFECYYEDTLLSDKDNEEKNKERVKSLFVKKVLEANYLTADEVRDSLSKIMLDRVNWIEYFKYLTPSLKRIFLKCIDQIFHENVLIEKGALEEMKVELDERVKEVQISRRRILGILNNEKDEIDDVKNTSPEDTSDNPIPKFLYHSTPSVNDDSIMQDGLQLGVTNSICLWDSPVVSLGIARRRHGGEEEDYSTYSINSDNLDLNELEVMNGKGYKNIMYEYFTEIHPENLIICV